MWIVAKIKKNNLNLFCSELIKKLPDIKYYFPKISRKSGENKNLLINYVFCFHASFKKQSSLDINKTTKGLECFLGTSVKDQEDIKRFINFCKNHEDEYGNITNSFFRKVILNQGKFISGPFSNYLFDLIKKDKEKISILIGDIPITVSNKSKHLYQPV